MSDDKPQWKPDLRRKVHKEAARAGLHVTYEALDVPPEPASVKDAREKWIKERFWKNRKSQD